jgi:hypothetical protein
MGFTSSADYPVVNAFQPTPGPGQNVFVSKLNAAGTALLYFHLSRWKFNYRLGHDRHCNGGRNWQPEDRRRLT